MKSLYEFNALNEKEKLTFVKETGTFLMYRMEGVVVSLHLYHAGDFFVEIWLNMEDNEIEFIRTFKSTKCLQPYLDEISVTVKADE